MFFYFDKEKQDADSVEILKELISNWENESSSLKKQEKIMTKTK